MPRILSRQNAGKSFVNSLTLHEGGTGKNTPTDALDALYGIPSGLKGEPLGPVELDGAGRLNLSALEGISLTDTGIDGDNTIQLRETKEYFLTTYDSYQTYEVEGVLGTARIERNVIYYTAGEMPGIGGFIINGRRINVLVQGIAMLKPSITVPINNAVDRPLFMTFIGSSFQTLGGSDTHVSSDWELATDINFVDVVQRSQDDSVNLTSWAVTDMQELKKHYVRVRYKGQNAGLSPWSNAVGFTTGNDGLINTETGIILPNTPEYSQGFGHSITLNADGNIALIGSPNYDEKGTDAGVVYYFKKIDNVWTQIGKIFSPFPAVEETFGFSVSTNNDATILFVGCWRNKPSILGKVYVFVRSGDVWTYQQEIRHPLRNINNDESFEFGITVAISGDGLHAVIGNHIDNYIPGGTVTGGEGGAYYFTRSGNTWTHVASLYSNEPNEPQYFGFGLSLNNDGTFLAIGSFSDTVNGVRTGSVYIYTRSGSTWTFRQKITPSVPSDGLQFGYAIALAKDASILYIGAPYQKGKVFKYSQSNLVFNYDNELILYNDNAWNNGISLALSSDKRFLMIGVGGGIFTSGAVRIIE